MLTFTLYTADDYDRSECAVHNDAYQQWNEVLQIEVTVQHLSEPTSSRPARQPCGSSNCTATDRQGRFSLALSLLLVAGQKAVEPDSFQMTAKNDNDCSNTADL